MQAPLDELALRYDTLAGHGWYANLEPTLAQLASELGDGKLLIDYSGGTGILVDHLLQRVPSLDARFLIVDASPKFLRLALEKLGGDPRVAFRWLRYLHPEKRLQRLDEVLGEGFRGDLLCSTNAIHLYGDLDGTLRSWHACLRPGGRVLVQSGNIDNPACGPDEWIIDRTVEAVDDVARRIVAADARYAAWRECPERAAYDALRLRVFPPVRPLARYLDALGSAGFGIVDVRRSTIPAQVEEWYAFLSAYHEGVLGWVGGVERITGRPPEPAALRDRLALLRRALDQVFGGRETFACCWTYLTAVARCGPCALRPAAAGSGAGDVAVVG